MNEPTPKLFQEELAAYAGRREELLRVCEGKFALFKGRKFCGTFDTVETAYDAGIERYGNVSFLIQPVTRSVRCGEQFLALELGLLHAHP